ncbi:hypothetical protein Tco_1144615 [Tanacetum coccineum]
MQNVQGRQAQGYVGSRAKGIANGTGANRNIGNSTANQTKTDNFDAFDSNCDEALMTSNNVTFIALFIPYRAYQRITSITVNGKNAYELKGKFLDDLHKNAFSGTNGEDAVENIEYFLKIVDLINLPNVNQDKLRVVVFPISLVGDAQRCGYSEWPTCSWTEDGYCNGGNLLGAYIVGNTLCYQDLEWYDALKDRELKEEALRNKAIMEDDKSNDEDDERYELFETHELPVCTIRRFEMIKYSFTQDEEYVAVKEDEYEDLMSTSKDACRAYQEIFCMMDEGWMDLAKKKLTMLVKYLQSGNLELLES